MLGGGRKGPGEPVDFDVKLGENITPQVVNIGETVDFSVDLTEIQPTNRRNVIKIPARIVSLFR